MRPRPHRSGLDRAWHRPRMLEPHGRPRRRGGRAVITIYGVYGDDTPQHFPTPAGPVAEARRLAKEYTGSYTIEVERCFVRDDLGRRELMCLLVSTGGGWCAHSEQLLTIRGTDKRMTE